jgi:hypothetical protein
MAMKVGDLIFDSHYGQNGIVIDVPGPENDTSFMTILYEDGQVDNSLRTNDSEIEVISECR